MAGQHEQRMGVERGHLPFPAQGLPHGERLKPEASLGIQQAQAGLDELLAAFV